MFRPALIALLIAGSLGSQFAALPHRHAGGGPADHGVRAHVHVGGTAHSHGHGPAATQPRVDLASIATLAGDHDADAAWLNPATPDVARPSAADDNGAKLIWVRGVEADNDALSRIAAGDVHCHPPDSPPPGCPLFLRLRNLRT
jgi:hypothetical protein